MNIDEIQKLSYALDCAMVEFNRSMPEGFLLTTETDGTLLITNEYSLGQTVILKKFHKQKNLSVKDIRECFHSGSF